MTKFKLNIILLLFLHCIPLQSQTREINLNQKTVPLINISQIVKKISPTKLLVEKGYEFNGIYEVLVLNNSIVALVAEDLQNDLPWKVLQYNKQGKLLRQIGEKYSKASHISLIYNSTDGQIGINDEKNIKLYNQLGDFVNSIPSLVKSQVYFNSHYFGVTQNMTRKKWHYEILKGDLKGKAEGSIMIYEDQKESPIGHFPLFSSVDNQLLISTQLDNILYSFENEHIEPKFTILSKEGPVRDIQYKDGWVISSTPDSKRGGRFMNFFSLSENTTYTARLVSKNNSQSSTIQDDLLNTGVLVPFAGRCLGEVEKTICFYQREPNISETVFTIYLAELK